MQASTWMWVHRFSLASAKLLWPSCCVICQRRGQSGLDLCSACESLLPALSCRLDSPASTPMSESLCTFCGSCVVFPHAQQFDPLPGCSPRSDEPPIRAIRCEACVDATSHITDILSPYRFDFPLDHLVHRLKYQHRRELARVFGVLLARAVVRRNEQPGCNAQMPELLLPVPAHLNRIASRDFNQAADMARWCASELGLRAVPGWAQRIVDTPSLAGLSRSERQLCIRGAFSVDARVADRHVAIVDDVLTSGATTGELARELLDSGAASVQLWVLARTASEGSSSNRWNCSASAESPDGGRSLAQIAW